MAAIVPGTNATIKSNTLEGQLHELLCLLQGAEFNIETNPSETDYISGTHNQSDFFFDASYSIPVEMALNENGELVYTASEYLTGLNFSAGTDGTFKSNSSLGYLMELVIYAQKLEASTTKNPTKYNYVSGTINTDSGRFSGSVRIPVVMSLNSSGQVVYSAKEYLLSS